MEKWNEKWRNCIKRYYYICMKRKGFLYAIVIVSIAARCFVKRFFTEIPQLSRRRMVACLCMTVILAVMLLHTSHSFMKSDGNHLTLQVQQNSDEIEEGYEDYISHVIVIEKMLR